MNDLTELPEKWCLQRTKEHGGIINKWFSENGYGHAWRKDNDWIYIKHNNSYRTTSKPIENNYNCITFEQFGKMGNEKKNLQKLFYQQFYRL